VSTALFVMHINLQLINMMLNSAAIFPHQTDSFYRPQQNGPVKVIHIALLLNSWAGKCRTNHWPLFACYLWSKYWTHL